MHGAEVCRCAKESCDVSEIEINDDNFFEITVPPEHCFEVEGEPFAFVIKPWQGHRYSLHDGIKINGKNYRIWSIRYFANDAMAITVGTFTKEIHCTI